MSRFHRSTSLTLAVPHEKVDVGMIPRIVRLKKVHDIVPVCFPPVALSAILLLATGTLQHDLAEKVEERLLLHEHRVPHCSINIEVGERFVILKLLTIEVHE